MSLIDDFTSNCTMLDKTTVPDGYGGFKPNWVDGAEFEAAITLDNSMQARIAEQQGVTGLYTVTTKKNINLQYHDVFRRNTDNKIFLCCNIKINPVSMLLCRNNFCWHW